MSKNKTLFTLIAATTVVFLCAGITYLSVPEYGGTDVVFALENKAKDSSAKGHDDHEGEKGHDDHDDEKGHDDHEGEKGHDDHEGEKGHDDHEGEQGDEDHEGEGMVHLSPERLDELDITLSTVHRGTVSSTLFFPAETMLDPDSEAHLVPRVTGIAGEIFVSIGDSVSQGDLLAVLESRELGRTKSEYLASLAMRDLAQATYSREKKLSEDGISAKQDYLEATQAYRAAQIDVASAEQALYVLGLSDAEVKQVPKEDDSALTRYEVRAPFDATVIERHISLGESIGAETEIFLLAKLDTIWVMGRVTERDIRRVSVGQKAVVQLEGYPGEEFAGKLDYLGSILDSSSRTINARVILDNPDKRIRAGMFGRLLAFIDNHEHSESLLVPNNALQRTNTGAIVYRAEKDGVFEPVAVEVLHASDTFTEVQGPLKENDRVAVGDIFVLKSEAGKEAMGGGHSH